MVIAGAGGHGLEVKQTLISLGIAKNDILFYDQDQSKSIAKHCLDHLILDEKGLIQKLKEDPSFVLGVGNPIFRENLFNFFTARGGSYCGINFISSELEGSLPFDSMPLSYVGPKTNIGMGVLVNVRAHVHHECVVGKFSEIGPGAMLLGGVEIGVKCRIGAGAVVLPGVKLGDEVVIGAGGVVTKNILSGLTVKGIPVK